MIRSHHSDADEVDKNPAFAVDRLAN